MSLAAKDGGPEHHTGKAGQKVACCFGQEVAHQRLSQAIASPSPPKNPSIFVVACLLEIWEKLALTMWRLMLMTIALSAAA